MEENLWSYLNWQEWEGGNIVASKDLHFAAVCMQLNTEIAITIAHCICTQCSVHAIARTQHSQKAFTHMLVQSLSLFVEVLAIAE